MLIITELHARPEAKKPILSILRCKVKPYDNDDLNLAPVPL